MTSKWVVDIETDGLEPTVIWCIVLQNVDNKEIVKFTPHFIPRFNDWLANKNVTTLIGHNIISYDKPVLENLLDTDFSNIKVEDTLLLSQFIEPRREGGHSLASWGDRLGFEKGDYSDWSKYTPEMLRYCVRDVEITTKVYEHLEVKEEEQEALKLEYKIKEMCSEQERYGWYFDEVKAVKLLQHIQQDIRDVEEEVRQVFRPLKTFKELNILDNYYLKGTKTPTKAYQGQLDKGAFLNDEFEWGYWDYPEFNLGSRQQIARSLQHYGWKPTEFTDKGQVKVDESVLAGVDIPQAQLIKRYLMLQKRDSMLRSWIENVNPKTNSIHGRVHTIGTITHRMSSSNPNMQQVTASGKEYGKEMRELFIVHKDKVLVGADLSGLELRCLAHYMNSNKYTQKLVEEDIHVVNQKAAGLNTRNEAKTFIYAFIYGGGDELVGKIVGGGKSKGRSIKDKFLKSIPPLKALLEAVRVASKRGHLKALDGRHIEVRSEHSALNFLLQSAGAIVAKRAWAIFNDKAKEQGLEYHQLGLIHDEAQIECAPEDADTIGNLLVESMEATTEYYNMNCPITGEYKVGNSWAETH